MWKVDYLGEKFFFFEILVDGLTVYVIMKKFGPLFGTIQVLII